MERVDDDYHHHVLSAGLLTHHQHQVSTTLLKVYLKDESHSASFVEESECSEKRNFSDDETWFLGTVMMAAITIDTTETCD
jgi:hypothetical protein